MFAIVRVINFLRTFFLDQLKALNRSTVLEVLLVKCLVRDYATYCIQFRIRYKTNEIKTIIVYRHVQSMASYATSEPISFTYSLRLYMWLATYCIIVTYKHCQAQVKHISLTGPKRRSNPTSSHG